MLNRNRRCFLLALLIIPITCAAQNAPPAPSPDSEKGLRNFLKELIREVRAGNEGGFAEIASDLALPGHQEWFVAVFGDELGQEMAVSYEELRPKIHHTLFEGLRKIDTNKFRDLRVIRQISPCLSGTTDRVFRILAARKTQTPFYSVSFRRGEVSRFVGFFVHVGGNFRWIGNVRFNDVVDTGNLPEVPPQPVGPSFQSKALERSAAPVYPPEARKDRIQGTVRLSAVIARDGTIKELTFVSGPCVLAEAAMTAVRQWRYRPTILHGELVEVVTTIDVVFTLSS